MCVTVCVSILVTGSRRAHLPAAHRPSVHMSLHVCVCVCVPQVVDAPIYLQHTDPHYVSQWRNATHWPKRILLAYKWETHNDIDLDRGLAVLLVAGMRVCACACVCVCVATRAEKLPLF